MKKHYLIISFLFIAILSNCGRKSEELTPPRIVMETAAIVNDTKIPLKMVNNLYKQLPSAHKEYYLHKKGRRTFLEDLIDRELIFQAAMQENSLWTQDEKEKVENDFIKKEVISKFLNTEFETLPPPTEEAIKKLYEENRSIYRSRSLESIKPMLRNNLMKQQQNKKKEDIIDLLRTMEIVVVNTENLKYLSEDRQDIEKHRTLPLFSINNNPTSLKDVIRYYRPDFERIQFHHPNVPQKLLDDLLTKALGDELIYLEGIKRGYDKNELLISTAKENLNRSITKLYLDTKLEVPQNPSQDDLQKFYDENKFEFYVPERYHLSQIMFKLPAKQDPENIDKTMSRAKEVLKKIKIDGEDFEKTAREFSEGPEKAIGGDIGYLSVNQMVPEFQKVITKIKVGEISDIIKTDFGFHIIKLEGKKESYIPEYKEIEDKVKSGYNKNLWNKKFDILIRTLRENAKIEVFEQYFME